MFNYKLEDMKLYKQKGGIFFGKEKIYSCERQTSREDKIAFVDKYHDGKLSYILSIIEKFEADRENLPKTDWGTISTVTIRQWLMENDNLFVFPLISGGKFEILGIGRNIISANEKGRYDTYSDLVDEAFHRQLKLLEKKEKEYFETHDEYCILRTTVRNKMNRFGTTFGVNIGDCSDGTLNVMGETWKQSRELTLEELKELDKKYDELGVLIEKLTAETKIEY